MATMAEKVSANLVCTKYYESNRDFDSALEQVMCKTERAVETMANDSSRYRYDSQQQCRSGVCRSSGLLW